MPARGQLSHAKYVFLLTNSKANLRVISFSAGYIGST